MRYLLFLILAILVLLSGCGLPDIPGLPAMMKDTDNMLFYGPFSFFAWTFIIVIYFMPTIIAIISRKSRMVTVLMINAFLGWTVIGWIIALILARM